MHAPAASVRARLRDATDGIHQALHRAAPFAAIADGTVTRDGYAGTLAFLYRYHTTMTPGCVAGAMALEAPELSRAHAMRISALRADLAHFGVTPPATVPEPAGENAFSAGVLYTVQGSTLGGKLIFRQLATLLPETMGRSFFQGTTDDSRDWQLLCARLEGAELDMAALEAGAQHAFACFAQMLADSVS